MRRIRKEKPGYYDAEKIKISKKREDPTFRAEEQKRNTELKRLARAKKKRESAIDASEKPSLDSILSFLVRGLDGNQKMEGDEGEENEVEEEEFEDLT